MAVENRHALQTLLSGLQSLTANQDYEALYAELERHHELDRMVKEKTKEIGELQTKHREALQAQLDTYNEHHSRLQQKNADGVETVQSLKKKLEVVEDKERKARSDANKQKDGHNATKQLLQTEGEKVAKLHSDIADLKSKIREKTNENESLKEKLQEREGVVEERNAEQKQLKEEKSALERNGRRMEKMIEDIKSYMGSLKDVSEDDVIKKFNDMWRSACGLVESTFREDIAEECLNRTLAWKSIMDSRPLRGALVLPRSNSPTAKSIRIAAILAILTHSMNQSIFRLHYLWEERDDSRSVFLDQSIVDAKKEIFYRAVLLGMAPETQKAGRTLAEESVVSHVSNYVSKLIPRGNSDSFCSALEPIVKQASDAWQLIQNSKSCKFELHFHPNEFEDRWAAFHSEDLTGAEIHGGGPEGKAPQGEPVLVVFPHISVVEQTVGPQLLMCGAAVMKHQVLEAAAKKRIEDGSSSPVSTQSGRRSSLSKKFQYLNVYSSRIPAKRASSSR